MDPFDDVDAALLAIGRPDRDPEAVPGALAELERGLDTETLTRDVLMYYVSRSFELGVLRPDLRDEASDGRQDRNSSEGSA